MNTITVESAGHLRELCDAAAGDPAGSVVCLDLHTGEEPEAGVEIDLVAVDPTDPAVDPRVVDLADDVATLPAPAAVPAVDTADEAAARSHALAWGLGDAAARAAWAGGLRSAPAADMARIDCEILARGSDIVPTEPVLRVAVIAYQRTHRDLRAREVRS